jgi:hypothetical protein
VSVPPFTGAPAVAAFDAAALAVTGKLPAAPADINANDVCRNSLLFKVIFYLARADRRDLYGECTHSVKRAIRVFRIPSFLCLARSKAAGRG